MYKMGSKFKINDSEIMLVASPDYKLIGVCPESGCWYFELSFKDMLYGSSYTEDEILKAYNDQYGSPDVFTILKISE